VTRRQPASPPLGGETIAICAAPELPQTLLEQLLTQRGYLTLRTSGQQEVRNVLAHALASALILTASVPVAQSIDLCQNLRRDFPVIPIIAVLDPKDRARAISLLESGADHYVIEPYKIETLLLTLTALSRHQRDKAGPASRLRPLQF